MKKAFVLLLLVCAGLVSATRPHDCIMTPIKQHVRATQYLVTGVVKTNLDATTVEGKNYRWLLRNLTQQDSLKRCVTASFEISQVLKGKLTAANTIEIVSEQGEAPVFKLGGHYVLFLRREERRFLVYSCSYSSELGSDPASAKLMQDISAALR